MYALQSALKGRPVISLQTGERIARLSTPVLDVTNFEIQAYACSHTHHGQRALLMIADIRQFAEDCVIIDDEDQLTAPEDLVRLAGSLRHNYSPIGKPVYSELGARLGTVEDYTINLQTSRIQRLHVRQALWKSWSGAGLDIDRTQIIDVTPERITVRDATIKEPVLAPDTLPEIQP